MYKIRNPQSEIIYNVHDRFTWYVCHSNGEDCWYVGTSKGNEPLIVEYQEFAFALKNWDLR